MRKSLSSLACTVLLLCLLLVGCASEPALVTTNSHVQVATGALPAPGPRAAYQNASEYRIGPLDLLTITVLGVPELSQDVRVNAAGEFSLPLIGAVRAGGRTVEELQAELAKKLSEGYLQSPQVTVFIKEYTSQRVTVEGAVQKPGVLPLTGPTTLLQAVAGSGGLADLADPRGVVVFRTINGQKMGAVFDLNAIRRGAADDPQLYGDDIVVVEVSGSKSKLREFIQASPLFFVFHAVGL
ncbi:MAG TPA: polysaccharide biosynthesis/export family protein [Xanthomonadaceae bacterium]|jgi:polysaccharide export outer membrane protein